MTIALAASLLAIHRELLPEFPVETGIRQECGGNHRHAPDTNVCTQAWRAVRCIEAAVVSTVAVTSAAAANAAAANTATRERCCWPRLLPPNTAAAQAAAANAAAAAAAAQQAAAGLPIGTMVPVAAPGCTSTVIGGVNYFQCGGVYYRAGFQGNNIVYIVSAP